MKVYLIRHGESTANVSRIMSGNMDVALTDTGLAQARSLAEKMRDIPLEAIFSSDLQRAVNTAGEIARGRNIEPIRTSNLRERNFGAWEGIEFDEIKNLYPAEWQDFLERGFNCDVPEGESIDSLYERVVREYERIVSLYDADSDVSICIVAHGCVLMALFSHLVYGNKDGYNKFRFDNARVNMVEIMYDFTVVRALNA